MYEPKRKRVVTLYVRDAYENGYNMRYVRVCERDAETIGSLIDGCVDNKIGYQNDETAKRQLDKYRALESMGVTVVYDTTFSDRTLDMTLKWQHYSEDQWCRVSFTEMGRTLEAIIKATKFVKRAARKIAKWSDREIHGDHVEWTLDNPDTFIKAVLSMRGVVEVCNYDTEMGDLSHEIISKSEAKGREEKAA